MSTEPRRGKKKRSHANSGPKKSLPQHDGVSLPRSRNRQLIRSNVALVRVVPLDPDELGAAAVDLPQVEPLADLLDEVLVLDGPAARLPPVPLPVEVPLGDALDRVLAVGANLDVLGDVDRLQGA